MSVKPWRRAQVIGTREHLLETAARLFAERGFAATPLESVVREAGLTRGAVYHHFKDKRALFEAVLEQVLRERVFAVEKRSVKHAARTEAPGPADPIQFLVEELGAESTRRIVLIDGPAVLGHERWSELLGEQLFEPIRRVVQSGGSGGRVEPSLVAPLTRLVFGAIREAALHSASQASHELDDGSDTREPADLDRALRLLVERLVG